MLEFRETPGFRRQSPGPYTGTRVPLIPLTLVVLILLVLNPVPAWAVSVKVTVQGVEGELLQGILAGLSLEKQKDHPYLNDTLIRRLHDQAPGEILRVLETFGYYSADIEPLLDHEGDSYLATYLVSTGQPVLLGNVDIQLAGEGDGDRRLVAHVREFPLAVGQPFGHALYEAAKKEFLALALQAGFLTARYTESRVLVSIEDRSAQVILHMDTGPRYKLGEVTFEQDFLSLEYLSGYVTFRRGDPYDQDTLLDLQRALYDSNLFSRVEILAPAAEAVGLVVPVRVKLEPGPRTRFTAGIGYGTDTGPRFRAGWENRRINRKVHRLRTDLLVSGIQNKVAGMYMVPLRRPRTDHLDYSLAFSRERVEDIESDSVLLGFNHVRLRGSLEFTEYLRYLWEDYNVATDEDRIAIFYPGLGFTWVRADSRVNTRKGFRLDLELQGAREDILSRISFLQARARIKFITSLGSPGRLILRGDRASTWTDDFDTLPASLRYFAGGDQSVRGFAYKSLSPLDINGEPVGGRHLVVASAEYELPLSQRWSAAVFTDVGNAVNDLNETLERGSGAGLRWKTIIGLFRLDIAWAVSREDNPWKIHLNIGPDL